MVINYLINISKRLIRIAGIRNVCHGKHTEYIGLDTA